MQVLRRSEGLSPQAPPPANSAYGDAVVLQLNGSRTANSNRNVVV